MNNFDIQSDIPSLLSVIPKARANLPGPRHDSVSLQFMPRRALTTSISVIGSAERNKTVLSTPCVSVTAFIQ
ncbi:hypothetical protein MASR2M18_11890 [Ignavibacteria bacterium]